MSFRSTSSGGQGMLAMGGSLTIANAARIRDELLRAFRETDRVVLELEEDAVADVSFMQILCSAHRTASLEKKTFTVNCSAPGVRLLMAAAGYTVDEQCIPCAGRGPTAVKGGPDE